MERGEKLLLVIELMGYWGWVWEDLLVFLT